jgi:hypothetical protein
LCSFFKKKKTNQNFKKKKTKPNRNRVKPTGFGSVFQGKNRFKPVWLGFSGFGLVFLVLARFRFGSVRFFTYKTETEPAGFFKILIGFFFDSVFSIFFSSFLALIGFSIFFSPLIFLLQLVSE